MADLVGQHIGQYEVMALLGEGGMAAVYRAYQASIKRDVAIKVIKPNLIQMRDFVKRFEREAQMVASLDHAHIVKIFDFGQQADMVYLVMPLLTGGSLADMIRQGPMPLDRISLLLDQVTGALDHAHKRGIIHRDLKPQNILLDSDGDAFLTDFGIAKLMQNDSTALTQTGTALGTPAYMPPEQWMGRVVDTRSDIYALGIILFEMLSGKLPYNSDTPYGLMHQHVYDPIPPIAPPRKDVTPAISRVVNKALAKDPDQRFQSAGELAAAFRSALAGRDPVPVTASATTPMGTPPPTGAMVNGGSRVPIIPIVAGIAVLVVLAIGALIALPGLTKGSSTPTAVTELAVIPSVTTIPTTIIPTITPSITPTPLPSQTSTEPPNAQTVAVQIMGDRQTQTANAIASYTSTPTPDIKLTAEAIVAASDTASFGNTNTALAVETVAAQTQTAIAAATNLAGQTNTVQALIEQTQTAFQTPTDTPIPPTAIPTLTPISVIQSGHVNITWFVGLGTGTQSSQIAAEHQVVDEFNSTIGAQDNISLIIQIAPSYQVAMDTITTEMAAGNSPDIVGPAGIAGSNALSDQWLDLKDLMVKYNYDTNAYDPALFKLYETPSGGYSAIPFAVYPALVFYNTDLFNEAGLNPLPTTVSASGTTYKLNGKIVPWNYTTLGQIAKILTVDKAGNDATSSRFDPSNIVQYGFNFQWAAMRLILTDIQPAAFYNASTRKVAIPDAWRTAIQWTWDGLWKYHYISTATAEASTLLQPIPLASGKLAMSLVPLWFACCMTDFNTGKAYPIHWNLGVVPVSLDNQTHVATDADTFRILKTTQNPDAAFIVMSYLLNQAVPELTAAYGAFPARTEYQKPWVDGENRIYTQGVDWQVALDSLKLANPISLHHESNLPDFQQIQDRFSSFQSFLVGDGGEQMDVPAEINNLQTDVQAMVNGAYPTETPYPTATP